MHRTRIGMIVILSSLICVAAHAQGPRRGQGRDQGQGTGQRRPGFMRIMPFLMVLDANGDGELSFAELENATAALKTLDKNGDRRITEDEVRPAYERDRGSGPGVARGTDRGSARGPGMDRANGQQQGRAGRPQRGAPARPGSRRRGGDVMDAETAQKPKTTEETLAGFMAFDKNGDKLLSKDELPPALQNVITRADINKDGVASPAELMIMIGN